MKKLTALVLIALVVLSVFSVSVAAAEEPEIKSGSAVIIDATTGQVLFDKNMNQKNYPASITKIMTIYLGSTLDYNKKLTASSKAIDAVPRDTSNIALDYGEEISVKDALYASQLMSANDASNVIAEGVSGTLEDFAELMNQTAVKFGAKNTHFANANGLFNKEHYTTAYDMALITKNALESEKFKKIFCSLEYTIGQTNKKIEKRNFVAQHRMVYWGQYQHLGVEGGKAGYTTESGHTLVSYGKRNGIEIVVVVMDSPDFTTVYKDTEKLLEYGYENFEYHTVTADSVEPKKEGRTTYTPKTDAVFLLEKGVSPESLKYTYTKDGVAIKTPDGKELALMEFEVAVKESVFKKIFTVILWVLGTIVAFFILIFVFLFINENKKRKKRHKKREYIKSSLNDQH